MRYYLIVCVLVVAAAGGLGLGLQIVIVRVDGLRVGYFLTLIVREYNFGLLDG